MPFQDIFDYKFSLLTFSFAKVVNKFLYDNGVIKSTTTFKEASLVRPDEPIKVRLYTIRNKFSDNFGNGIAKANPTEVSKVICVFKLGD